MMGLGLGLGSGDVVPLCFEKSMWTAVSVLGAVKTGSAFVLLDPFLPEERLRAIVRQIRPKLCLSSVANVGLASRLTGVDVIIAVGPDLRDAANWLPPPPPLNRPKPDPSSLVYVVFTSGSTGVPKGCAISHSNLCSALWYQIHRLGFGPTSGVFDFASYSFDVAIHNLFAAWVAGGYVCIPSDEDRTGNLAHAIHSMGASVVNLTPTVARLLDPETVPTLKTLILLGEPVTEHDAKAWWGRVRMVNAYGPTECTSLATINDAAVAPSMLPSIGRGKGAVTWIVDPQDHNVLASWGETGELLIEGPIVGIGYLDDPEKTAKAFIQDPSWLARGAYGVPGRRGRLYKTGDLARYDEMGEIIIVGRTDNQVKIHGNRVELGEVDRRVQDTFPKAVQVVTEAIQPAESETGHDVLLAVFLKMRSTEGTPRVQAPTIHGQRPCGIQRIEIGKGAEVELARYLPPYMIPTLFYTINRFPLTLTGKVDRKFLREMGVSFIRQAANQAAEPEEKKQRQPHTAAEHQLRDLWAAVLGTRVPREHIGADDNFFALGGDSISAMKLGGAAKGVGFDLAVSDILRQPVLREMATLMGVTAVAAATDVQHGAGGRLAAGQKEKAETMSRIDSFGVSLCAENVDEIWPLSDMQESFVVEGLAEGRQFVDYYFLDLGPAPDTERLEESCRAVVQTFPILRASFVPCGEGDKHVMVVPKRLVPPLHMADSVLSLEEASRVFCLDDVGSFRRNQAVVSFTLLRHRTEGTRLVVRLSHAQYDAIAVEEVFTALMTIYHGCKAKRPPELIPELTPASQETYATRIAAQTRTRSMKYWRKLLGGADGYTDLGTSTNLGDCGPSSGSTFPVPYRIEKAVRAPPAGTLPPDTSLASFISASWALFLFWLVNKDDVVFGRLVHGRNSVPAVRPLVGCCINVVPLRLQSISATTVKQLIQSVHEQHVAMADADAVGFREIARSCFGRPQDLEKDWPAGPGAVSGAKYSCVMHQNVNEALEFRMGDDGEFKARLTRFENPRRLPYFFYVISFPKGGEIGLQVYGHDQMVPIKMAKRVLDVFCLLVDRLISVMVEDSGTRAADVLKGLG
jgi:amino acid adenylation domain-containing protein